MHGLIIYDLFDETEEDGDDDGGFDGFAEDDEEDGDGEEVFRHCFSLLNSVPLQLTVAHAWRVEEGREGVRGGRERPEGDGRGRTGRRGDWV